MSCLIRYAILTAIALDTPPYVAAHRSYVNSTDKKNTMLIHVQTPLTARTARVTLAVHPSASRECLRYLEEKQVQIFKVQRKCSSERDSYIRSFFFDRDESSDLKSHIPLKRKPKSNKNVPSYQTLKGKFSFIITHSYFLVRVF